VSDPRRPIYAFLGPYLKTPGWNNRELREGMDRHLDLLGVPREPATAPPPGQGLGTGADAAAGAGGDPAAVGGQIRSEDDLTAMLGNRNAPALTDADFEAVAAELGVPVKLIKAVRKVEAPRGPFDDKGRPSILYEKHVFARNSAGRFNGSHPALSAASWQPGTYGPHSAQYGKLAAACRLDQDAAFKACSWGAFQVLGENAVSLDYRSAFDMALALTFSEAAHLDSFVRFVKVNGLVDELRACKAGDPESCVPFVRAYNGSGFRKNNYHVKLAEAAR
jgi:hypothetical protein